MKKLTPLVIMLLMSVSVWADDKDCEAAVDAAARMTDDKGCDYSNTGLNGVLHRAFANKDDSTAKEKVIPAKDIHRDNADFSSAAEWQTVHFTVLQKAAKACPAGFAVDAEHYLPQANNVIRLDLQYHCVK